MKILVVSEPGIDGVFRHVEGLLHHLLDHGFEVLYAWSDRRTCDRLFDLVQEVERRGGQTLRLSVGNGPAPSDIRAILQLAAFARKHQPDVIHGHSSKAGVLARALPFLGVRSRFIYTPHAYYRMHDPRGLKAHFFHTIEAIFGRVGWTGSLSPSEAAFAQHRLRLPGSRLVRIDNGVNPDRFTPPTAEEKRKVREELGIPTGARVLGTLGRLTLQKDPVTLYQALALATAKHGDLFLVHLGKGELELAVEKVIADHHLTGRVLRIPYMPNPLSFYRSLDGFILTSLYEGMSYAMLEALSLNLPLLLTRSPGSEQFADFGLTHLFWATPGDPTSVASAISQWHASLDGGTAPNHREVTINSLSEKKCFGRLCDHYRQMCRS